MHTDSGLGECEEGTACANEWVGNVDMSNNTLDGANTADTNIDDGNSTDDERPPTQPVAPQHRSIVVRAAWLSLGLASLALGGAGVVLPGLPTTPFILVSAFCFARSSDRFLNWLLNSPVFGPIIREWREHRALPSLRVKIVALSVAILCFAASIVYFAVFSSWWWASIVLGVLCLALCTFLLRMPIAN